jgi:hypothetical protein
MLTAIAGRRCAASSRARSASPYWAAARPGVTAFPPERITAQCPVEWQFYCEHIHAAVDTALRKGKQVLIVTEPYLSDKHVAQQNALESALRARFSGQPRVRYLNLGRAVDLRDKSLCWDGMHLTAEGNRRVATALSQPVMDLLRD